MRDGNTIVESNIKNLAMGLMNEQRDLITVFIDSREGDFSDLSDSGKRSYFESVHWKLWYFLMFLYLDEKRGYQAPCIMESCYLEDHWQERNDRGGYDNKTMESENA